MKHDVAFDLEKHRETLTQIIEMDIIAAYYYQAGSIEAGLNYDRQLKEAERLLRNSQEYKKILAPQKPKETSSLIRIERKMPETVTVRQKEQTIFSAIA